MDKITKLPWKATLNAFVNDSYVYIIKKDSYISDGKVAVVDNMTDAEYICRAVNSHEGLVEALKKALRILKTQQTIYPKSDFQIIEEQNMEEALKAADGEGV